MRLSIRNTVAALPMSPTLHANQAAAERRRLGHRVYHMGFGQAPFPVHPLLARALAENADANRYESVAGIAELRETALRYFADRLGVDPENYQLLVAPGSKLILYALQLAVAGDVIVPVPSWVSYAPQATILGDRVVFADAALSDAGYHLSTTALQSCLDKARAAGLNPTKLILNSPNNPTGLNLPTSDHAALAKWCAAENILIISDEIYALTHFDQAHVSIGKVAPAATITTGLSKHISLGGWRIGFGLIPASMPELFTALCSIASETWSAVSAPIQRAALVAVSSQPEIEDFVSQCTAIHRAVSRYVARQLRDAGLHCPMPGGAFYLWPDFDSLRQQLSGAGIATSEQLAAALLQRDNLLALPGVGFGAPAETLLLRLAITDYDGHQALQLCKRRDPDTAVADFAPQVVAATDRLCRFVEHYRSQAGAPGRGRRT